jgi:hypothetical protein
MDNMLSSNSSQAPKTIVRTTEDLLAYLQRKNPEIIPFDHEGRQCIKFKEFYMAVCDVGETAAPTAKKRLIDKQSDLNGRVFVSE